MISFMNMNNNNNNGLIICHLIEDSYPIESNLDCNYIA